MIVLPVKPISTNRLYSTNRKGQIYKTSAYKEFVEKCKFHIYKDYQKNYIKLPDGKLNLDVKFGVSSASDLDNCLKGFIDILQDIYNFNDNRISKIQAEKLSTKRGEEYIQFELGEYIPSEPIK